MTGLDILREGVKALDSKKAYDIKIIKVRDITILADYFVIADGTSNTHVKALADEIEYKLTEKGVEPKGVEGRQSASWIVLDYYDVIFHVFQKESRSFYDLERLWQDGEEVDVEQFLAENE